MKIDLSLERKIENSSNPRGNILFIHGFTSSNILHIEFEKTLDPNYNYYSFNLPGHNENKMGIFRINEFDFQKYVDYIINYIKKNNLTKIILIGHSMGGGLALFVYNKIKHLVDKIILVAPINKSIYTSKIGLIYLFSLFFKNKKTMKQLVLNNPNIDMPLLHEYLDFEFKKLFNYKFRYLFLGNKLLSPILLSKLDNYYKNIDVPTLVILGSKDRVIPYKRTVKMLTKYNNSNIIIKTIENCGHLLFVENFNKYKKLTWDFIYKDIINHE